MGHMSTQSRGLILLQDGVVDEVIVDVNADEDADITAESIVRRRLDGIAYGLAALRGGIDSKAVAIDGDLKLLLVRIIVVLRGNCLDAVKGGIDDLLGDHL